MRPAASASNAPASRSTASSTGLIRYVAAGTATGANIAAAGLEPVVIGACRRSCAAVSGGSREISRKVGHLTASPRRAPFCSRKRTTAYGNETLNCCLVSPGKHWTVTHSSLYE